MQGEQLQRYLQRTIARRVSLTLDDDRKAILSSVPGGEGSISLRLHGSFLDAPSRIIRALVRFLKRPEPRLRRHVQRLYRSAGLDRVGTKAGKRRIVLRHKGLHFDLKAVFDDLNARYFEGRLEAFVTWGRRTNASQRVRSIHFGSYNWARRVIRVHPDLDRDYVPRYFLDSVLFHEMLHADLGVSESRDGRRSAHTPEFQRREREFPDYARARDWEKAHLHYFLRGTPRVARGAVKPRRLGRGSWGLRGAARRGGASRA